MHRINETEEFDEAELYGEEHEQKEVSIEASEASEVESSDQEFDDCKPGQASSFDAGIVLNNSAKSTTMAVTINEEHGEHEEPHDGISQPVTRPGRAFTAPPPPSSNIRMGSSVPINIPFLAERQKKDITGADGVEQQQWGTFIPPHQLSQRDDFMFSLTGQSPATAIKRERLRVRNAILKSTGFLENHSPKQWNATMQEKNKMGAGGLSQALHAL
mmetsp:Transcript_6775/g.14975  ORF Transcript_6775/g.14975 Transcript_6775/m.14975 type:complete len:216 (-) Transcript_6775:891-1538(-)|eukprot:CAMPEP_0202902542 /NCGR_PEP_ID=MMETSP1392-20130828/16911_1 /ASSEMBLY_ACC=CAM_ASM_000868 /TAXON_ID=225041 /ORGANISM="Chlamydomonas chlamydogama, Strain SAG 11-48b" /LENGTH=215 /DNA_ID=CAMNT_0049589321 /DNA_START=270 /DNA_END=917 /DNA_ORIENTATION=+